MICEANNPIGIIDSGSVVSPASSMKPENRCQWYEMVPYLVFTGVAYYCHDRHLQLER
jgi:hypothetical protein